MNAKMIYKIFFQVRFPTLLYFYVLLIRVWEEEIKKIQKILANSVENADVVFEHSGVKKDIIAHSPNKKPSFLIYELFKETCTESNVAKRVLGEIERWFTFYLHVY